MLMKELLHNIEYDPVSFQDKKEILLEEEAYTWIVTEGIVNVFASERKHNKSTGRKYYIAQYSAGDILFGMQPYPAEEGDIVFLCSGMKEAKLARISNRDMDKLLQDLNENHKTILSDGVLKWFRQTEESLNEYIPTFNWTDNFIEKLPAFNQSAIKGAAKLIEKRYIIENKKIMSKQMEDCYYSKASLIKLAEITEKKNQKLLRDRSELSKHSLAAVCQLVGDASGIRMEFPPDSVMENSKNLLYDIVSTSQIRFRQIILSGEWWKQDNGPILGFLTEGREPVALIPITEKKYKMVNPADSSERVIDSKLAQQLNPRAYMFYRGLPEKKLKLSDVVSFCCFGLVKKDFIRILLIGIIVGILNMSVPIANAILFNNIIPSGEKGQLLQTAFLLISFGISGALFQLARSIAFVRIENRMETSLQAALWDRLISLPMPFFRKYNTGELAMRAMGFSYIRQELSGMVITTILTAVFSMFNFILLLQYSPKLSLYSFLLILMLLAFTFICGKFQFRYRRKLIELSNRISGLVFQLIGGIARFRTAGAEIRAFHQWTKEFGKQKELDYKNKLIGNSMTVFNTIFPVIASLVIFFTAYHTEKMDTGSFIAFYSAFCAVITAMLALSEILINMINVQTLYESSKPILQAVPEYDGYKENPGELDGSIELSHITFRYEPDAPTVIDDFSLNIKKGEYVAIVGPSGCGKSTILRLLLGFERPVSGKIYYDRHDMEKVDLRSIRRQLGVVMQNSELMSGDIRSNLMGMNPNLTMEDAARALKMAGIYEDIEAMPMGLFTAVPEGGSTLSGGQRQRLLIARVLINKPKIIFFDEATSALDNKTQAIVSKSLDSINSTRVVIAHRLSTIIHCDRILVMDKGKIAEEGSYQELMEKKSLFYELAKRQLA
ncbi:MAG: bacteriocin system transporter, ATP-binding protein [Lachnospiraceae bacterium]|nr:bacteriocin system transporter, ATP-binding protein [Lachnospiraceae bacterium]